MQLSWGPADVLIHVVSQNLGGKLSISGSNVGCLLVVNLLRSGRRSCGPDPCPAAVALRRGKYPRHTDIWGESDNQAEDPQGQARRLPTRCAGNRNADQAAARRTSGLLYKDAEEPGRRSVFRLLPPIWGLYRGIDTRYKPQNEDHAVQVMLHWFISEQVEEEKLFRDILAELRTVDGQSDAFLLLDRDTGIRTGSDAGA